MFTMTKDKALHKALKVLNCLNNDRVYETAWVKGAINACEEALEQPAQEPVAFIYSDPNGNGYASLNPLHEYKFLPTCVDHKAIPLYTHPHQWQGLTDDEIFKIGFMDYMDGDETIEVVREIEAKLKEKNYGN